jgi:rod shape-determining protein MreD
VNGASWARLVLVAITAVLFQVSVLDDITVLGAHPDVMVVIAAAGGIVAGPGRGAIIGFVAGCLSDLTVSLPFGFGPLTFVLVGFGSSYLLRAASGRDIPVAEVSTTVVASVAGTVLYAVLAAAVGQPGMFGAEFARVVLIVAAGAIVVSWAVLGILRWVLEPSNSVAGIGIG